jgi:ornithine decarboxylase
MKLKGVSFHVGSGGCSFNAYKESIEFSKEIFQIVESKGMLKLTILDIGGGFSMDSKNPKFNFD